ncbi:ATP-binding protein [Streptomyces sp. NPDC057445]|uniref:ATP-binding protein n=1 Tax=Streptomyces sp. NPDC057445 TaxID=3346136 RepID=UPI0036789137
MMTRRQGRSGPAQLRRRVGRSDLRAVPEVRRALRDLLGHGDWGGPGSAEVAELLISELVTNALIHTDEGALVTATVAPARLRVEVRDFTSGPQEPQLPVPAAADDSTHGRGLVLVQNLADAWGVRAHALGKVVWFELDGGQK